MDLNKLALSNSFGGENHVTVHRQPTVCFVTFTRRLPARASLLHQENPDEMRQKWPVPLWLIRPHVALESH